MQTAITIAILAAVLGCAIAYLRRAKKKGRACIGCPAGDCCSGNCGGCKGCHQ